MHSTHSKPPETQASEGSATQFRESRTPSHGGGAGSNPAAVIEGELLCGHREQA